MMAEHGTDVGRRPFAGGCPDSLTDGGSFNLSGLFDGVPPAAQRFIKLD
jgi:hypothetical protein